MELVRTFRTYYDHFRFAFPQLSTIPKHYDPNWYDEFRVLARDFVGTEDMHSVKHVFDCAGYGTDLCDKRTSLNIDDLRGRFDKLIKLNGYAKNEASGECTRSTGQRRAGDRERSLGSSPGVAQNVC